MVLSKFGFSAKDVWAMTTVEISAWVETYQESLGIKPKEDNTVVSKRIPLAEIKKQYQKGR